MDILGVTNKRVNFIPKNGFASTISEDITCGKFRVVRSLSKNIIEGTNILLCSGNPEFQQESKNYTYSMNKLKSNFTSIKLFGERTCRLIIPGLDILRNNILTYYCD